MPRVSKETAGRLAGKLQQFAEGLEEDEANALGALMQSVEAQFEKSINLEHLMAVVADSPQVMDEIRELNERAADAPQVGPTVATWTITTLTTTLASHPLITCGPREPDKPISPALTPTTPILTELPD